MEILTRNLQPIGHKGPSMPVKGRMTSDSETQQEAVAVRLGTLSTKTKRRIGFWSVRTM